MKFVIVLVMAIGLAQAATAHTSAIGDQVAGNLPIDANLLFVVIVVLLVGVVAFMAGQKVGASARSYDVSPFVDASLKRRLQDHTGQNFELLEDTDQDVLLNFVISEAALKNRIDEIAEVVEDAESYADAQEKLRETALPKSDPTATIKDKASKAADKAKGGLKKVTGKVMEVANKTFKSGAGKILGGEKESSDE